MKRFFRWLKGIFFPAPGSTTVRRVLPFVILTILLITVFIGSLLVWETTNATVFCGTACHTMPPQYVTHQLSSHASITCEDCHMGRAPIFEMIRRKAVYSWQTGTAMLFNTYHYPIVAKNMSPASEACLPCHNPEKFANDKLVQLNQYGTDAKNPFTNIFLILKTGGGTRRAGLGYGIHWHIENPVYYYATDEREQEIPYVRVNQADGKVLEFIDTEANFDPKSINESKLQKMDCISCHNLTAHSIMRPEDAVNQMMTRNLVSPTIPEIRKKAVDVLSAAYKSEQESNTAIDGLVKYYQDKYADFYAKNTAIVKFAVETLKGYYRNSVFFDQKVDWNTHPNNIGHEDSPGCFRCHDGKHLTASGEAVRLECNICHSIPVVSSPNQLIANIPVNKGIEPTSHKNTNFITLHRQVFDNTCAGCHTVEDPGGSSDKSFCSNSACHGQPWTFAGFDAPMLREKLKDQLPKVATATPAPTRPAAQATPAPTQGGTAQPAARLTWATIGALFQKCTACHGTGGAKGLDLSSYKGTMTGSSAGAVIAAGNPDGSSLVALQKAGHVIRFTEDELNQVIQWIKDGALEK